MKYSLAALLLTFALGASALGAALEFKAVPGDQVQKFAPAAVSLVGRQIPNPPLKVDAWIEKAQAFYAGKAAVALVPDKSLSGKVFDAAGERPVPLGLAVLTNAALGDGEHSIDPGRLASVGLFGVSAKFSVFFLAARRRDDGDLDLVVFSKDPTPVLTTPLKNSTDSPTAPLTLKFEPSPEGAGAGMTLQLAGGHEATLQVTQTP